MERRGVKAVSEDVEIVVGVLHEILVLWRLEVIQEGRVCYPRAWWELARKRVGRNLLEV
jgi:hypothetical protein